MKKKWQTMVVMGWGIAVSLFSPLCLHAGEGDASPNGSLVSANKLIDQIQMSGDLRVRYELMEKELKSEQGDDTTRDRLRTRFRLGLVWNNREEGWQACAGLATGDDSPTSTNDTWSEAKPFETGDIRLDYAYVKHQWDDFSAALGQQPNPYQTSWVLWDSDVRLSGLTLAYGAKEGPFAAAGVYGAKYVNKDDTALLYMGQVGYRTLLGEKGKVTAAAGYHTYASEMIREEAALGPDGDVLGLGEVDPNQYDLNIGDLYGDVTLPAGPAVVKMYGHFWMNFGADGAFGQAGENFPEKPEDSDTGWVLGAEAKFDKVKVGYAYAMVEADSLFGYLADADLGDGLSKTNKKGHRLSLSCNITKNMSTDLTYLYYKRIKDYSRAKEDAIGLAQLDVNYKF